MAKPPIRFVTAKTWNQYTRQCRGKMRHKTSNAAERHKLYREQVEGAKYRSYECPFCGHWHIGHDRRNLA